MLDDDIVCNLAAPVSESTLHAIARRISSLLSEVRQRASSTRHSAVARLDIFLEVLSVTVYDSAITSSHRTAAINVLCGVLMQLSSAPEQDFNELASQQRASDVLLATYMDRFDGSRQKSMEQLLSTLIKLLAKSSLDVHGDNLAVRKCIDQFFDILFQGHDRVKAKCSLHALTLFLSRGLISSTQLVAIYKQSRALDDQVNVIQDLLYHVFEWVMFSDVAPGAGQFSSLLIQKSAQRGVLDSHVKGALPAWAAPLTRSIDNHIDVLREYKNQIFPGLFTCDIQQYWSFLLSLNIRNYFDLPDPTISPIPFRTGEDVSSAHDAAILFSALEVGTECGLVKQSAEIEGKARSIVLRKDSIIITSRALGRLLSHASSEARLAGLSMLVLCRESTRPFSNDNLDALRRTLPHMHADTDANFRGEVVSLSQALIYRLRSITSSASRGSSQITSTAPPGIRRSIDSAHYTTNVVQTHTSFLRWYTDFLGSQLHPSVSYQRHITAIKAIHVVLQSGLDDRVRNEDLARLARKDISWPSHLPVLTFLHFRTLTDLLLNAFDDVRQGALDILKLVPPTDQQQTWGFIMPRADAAMRPSGRVDYADGVARLVALDAHRSITVPQYTDSEPGGSMKDLEHKPSTNHIIARILTQTEESVGVAEERLVLAVEKWPIHGHMTALRYIVDGIVNHNVGNAIDEVLVHLLSRITDLVWRIWKFAKLVLCNDAPEGFVPEELDDESALTTKDISSYAWRSVKEASLLVRATVSPSVMNMCYQDQETKQQHLQALGDLCFIQLAELRHRGAFSTVAQTFGAVCSQCSRAPRAETRDLLSTWYNKTLALVDEKGGATTRRSAGIPALVVAICNAEPISPSIEEVMTDLEEISSKTLPSSVVSSSPVQLPQVHAMNCLRTLFLQSKLAERLESHIVTVMSIAATSLTSSIWAIRNVGLILFRGLIDRLLGSNEKIEGALSPAFGIVSRLSYDRYPGLLDLALSLLSQAQGDPTDDQDSPAVDALFPVLDLLRRAPPPTAQRHHIRQLVLKAVGSKHWHVRELASRTFAASIDGSELMESITTLLIDDNFSQNELHGRLLSIRHLIMALAQPGRSDRVEQIAEIFTVIVSTAPGIFEETNCESVRSTYMDCLNAIYQAILFLPEHDLRSDKLLQALTYDSISTSHVLEGLPIHGGSLQQTCELNAWMAHLATTLLQRAVSDDRKSPPIGNLHPAIFTESTDVDTSSLVLEKLTEILQTASRGVQGIFVDAVARFALQDSDMHEACEHALCTIILASTRTVLDAGVKSASLVTYLRRLDIAKRFRNSISPAQAERSLVIWGLVLAVRQSHRITASKTVHQDMQSWIAIVHGSLNENNDFDLRLAAIRSLLTFLRWLEPQQSIHGDLQEQLALALYDALNDDDSDLREMAAQAVGRFNSLENHGGRNTIVKVPIVAARSLCTYLVQHRASAHNLLGVAIGRLTGQSVRMAKALEPVNATLRQVLHQKRRLFEEEKQNLYRDNVREAEIWACVLMRLSWIASSQVLIDTFVTWTMEGLNTLMEQTKSDLDGPLGWSSKGATFTLGMRVLCAVNVLLKWRQRSSRVRIKGSELRRKLHELADYGKEQDLHPLWLIHIEKTLEQSVRERVQRVAAVLGNVRGAIGPA